MRAQISTKEASSLLRAGKAILTFQSQKTGTHFTYKITKAQSGRVFFCSLLTGPDNTSNYQYFGILVEGGGFRTTQKAKISPEAKGVKAFQYVVNYLDQGRAPKVDIFHEGRCCRCGRKLTTPESIKAGIGPKCKGL